MKVFFTSDLHFGHKNVIKFDNRPFLNVDDMDEVLISNWNRKVQKDDMVYVLGDISWYNDQKTCEIFERLNGRKILIRGNHDRVHGKIKNYFEDVTDYKEITLPGNRHIVLCHYPIIFFNRHHYGSYMFYGHVHNSQEWQMTDKYRRELEGLGIDCNMYNVGVMVNNYEPVTFDEVIKNYNHNKDSIHTTERNWTSDKTKAQTI